MKTEQRCEWILQHNMDFIEGLQKKGWRVVSATPQTIKVEQHSGETTNEPGMFLVLERNSEPVTVWDTLNKAK